MVRHIFSILQVVIGPSNPPASDGIDLVAVGTGVQDCLQGSNKLGYFRIKSFLINMRSSFLCPNIFIGTSDSKLVWSFWQNLKCQKDIFELNYWLGQHDTLSLFTTRLLARLIGYRRWLSKGIVDKSNNGVVLLLNKLPR